MNLKTLANKLTTELTGNLSYIVTDDTQLFSEDMRLGDVKYVPAVVSHITSFVPDNKYSSTHTYQITFKVEISKLDNFYTDMATFRSTQSDEIIGTDYVSKITYQEVFQREETENGFVYKEFTVDLIWTYSLSVVGSQAIIKIDDVVVPFMTCNVVHDVAYVSNQAEGTNYRMTNDIVTLTLPLILSNAKIEAIYEAVNTDVYNTEYELDIDGAIKTVVLKKSNMTLNRDGNLTSIVLVLETAYPRVSITLDNVELPITAYQYQGRVTTTDGKKSSLDAILRTHGVSKVRSWSITFVKTDSPIYQKIVNDAYGNTLDTTYTLIRDGVSYTLMLADAVERYTETGDMMIECQFIDYGGA